MPPRKRRQSNQGEDTGKDCQDRLLQCHASSAVTDKCKTASARGAEGSSFPSTSGERRLTARQAAKQEHQTEGGVATVAEAKEPRLSQPSTGAATRSSTRVVKRPRRDLSPPESPVKKSTVQKVTKTASSTPETKTKRQWELWSVEDKNTFFDALCEYGKDFDSIHNAIVNKCRKRGIAESSQVKNKEQVRHFYYRTWHKISKLIQPVEDLKKDIQELYGLISYGVMRKRIRGGINPGDKNWQKLNQLVHQGSTTVKVKGKNLRIKTPICPALKKLNNIEEPRKDLATQVPDKITLEFRPKTNVAWSLVQGLAQNPRLRITTKPERCLASVIRYLDRKWRPHRLKLKEGLDSSEEPTKEFHVYPHGDSVFTAVNLNVAEEPKLQFGLDTYKDTVQISSPVSSKCKKGGHSDGRKVDNSSEACEAVISEKLAASGKDSQQLSAGPSLPTTPLLNTGLDPATPGASGTNSLPSVKSASADVSAIVEGENAMFPDDMLPMQAAFDDKQGTSDEREAGTSTENKTGTSDETTVKAEVDETAVEGQSPQPETNSVDSDESSQRQVQQLCQAFMEKGWNGQSLDNQISVAELYLMFGGKGELKFEYEWCDKVSSAIQDTLLSNLTNMLRRLANLATIEFTDFSKTPGVGSPCHMCGTVIGKQSRGQTGKATGKSPPSKGANRSQKDMSTQTHGSPVTGIQESSRLASPAANMDSLFRVPVANPYQQKSLSQYTLTDKELVQRINPHFSKPQIRQRKLKSVNRKPVVVQRTILPKAQVPSRQMVTFLPVVAGQSMNGQSADKDGALAAHSLNHTVISQAMNIQFDGTDRNSPSVSMVTSTGTVLQSNHLMSNVSLGEASASPGTPGRMPSPSAMQMEMSLSPSDDQTLLTIPADVNLMLSPRTLKASGLSTAKASVSSTTSNIHNVVTSSSISPPNMSSILDMSFSNISTVGEGDKPFMDISIDGTSTGFTGLLEDNKVLSVDPGLTTPPMRNDHHRISPTHSPPVRSLFKITSPTPDTQWLNGEVPDLSLTSFLESPVKPVEAASTADTVTTHQPLSLFCEGSRDSLSARLDVDSTLQCMMNESSMDYVKKFADLAEQIAQGEAGLSHKPKALPTWQNR